VLGLERVGVEDNFFELGGDSILSIQIVARAAQSGLRISPKLVFEHQTVAALAAAAGTAPAVVAEQGVVVGEVPLTPIQRRLLSRPPEVAARVTQSAWVELDAPVDPAALEGAIAAVVAHHDALRLRVEAHPGGWRAHNAAHEEAAWLRRVDLAGLDLAAQDRALEAEAAALADSFDLARGPLLRAGLFDLGPRRRPALALAVHHLAVDAVSWTILLEDLLSAYDQLRGGAPAPRLAAKTTSFRHWARCLAD
jgi:hypothetical protein